MPDVGVLQLKISADASSASRSLKTLQTRLSEISTIASNFNLENVSTQIGNIVKQVSSDKAVSTATKNLASLLNAISSFSKVTKIGLNKSQIEQIGALQEAVSGFNLGQSGTQLNKLREALGGEWNIDQASKARDALEMLSQGAKSLTESGTSTTIKETARSVDQMASGTANEIKSASTEMEHFGQAAGNTSDILGRLGTLQSSIFGRIPSHYMSMQGSVLNETAGFAESASRIKDVSVVTQDATKELQSLKSTADETANSVDNIDISGMAKDVEQAANYMGLADKDIVSAIEDANSRLERQVQLRHEAAEANKAATQALLEKNYVNYRSAFLSGEESWREKVPDMYGFSTKALEEGETYAEALEITMREVNQYVDEYIAKLNMPSGPLLRDTVDDVTGVSRQFRNALDSASNMETLLDKRERLQQLYESAKRVINEFSALENVNEKISGLTTKLGFVQEDIEKEMSLEEPSERKINELELRINSIARQIDTLNGKSISLDIASGITPESLAELSTIERLIQKRDEMTRVLEQEIEGNKLSVVQIMDRAGQIETLTSKIEKLIEAEEEEKSYKFSVQQTNEIASTITQYDHLIEKLEEAKIKYNEVWNDMSASPSDRTAAALGIHKAEDDIRKYNELKELLQNVSPEIQKFAQEQLDAGVSATTLKNRLFDLDGELKHKKTDVKNVSDETKTLATSFSELMLGSEGLGGTFKRMFPAFSGLLNRFKQLVKYRMLRAIIKQISEGFREGTENYYKYSEAIGGSFAPALDSAVSSIAQMKNSIGAAAAPVIQALIPYLQMAVNWFITAINYANQFFALINGQTSWSRAVPQTAKAFDNVKKSAGGASAAMKDLLADWDELNIIQSESGGGGGGGGASAMEDYLNMFEEVSEFNKEIQDILNFIEEKFGGFWELAKKIGSVLLGWKISNAFKGIIGTLGGLLAALGLIDLEFNISAILNGEYLKTGEIGWLVADVLQALIGGVLMKKILGNVLNGEYAYLGIPIMLTVNAISRVITLLGSTDVDALSKEAIISNIVSALEFGGVAGYLAYTAGATAGQALKGGAVGAILAFSALTSLKADVDAIRNGEITEETIKAKALSALGLSVGAAMAAKLLVPGVSTAQALGFGLASGTAATLLTMSATLGIVATIEALNSGITQDVLLKDVASSLSMGLGSALVIKMITADSWKIAGIKGTGIGIATLGALIGIQATCEAIKNNEISSETIIEDATASLLMGGGVALVSGTLIGVGAGTALTVGGLVALATFGALIGIQAIIQTVDGKDKIKWGNETLTESEVQAFVNEKIFDVKLPVAISLVQSKIEDSEKAGKELEDKVGDVLPIINTLLLGFDIEGSLAELDKEIFGADGLIERYNKNGEAKTAEIEAALTLVPIKDGQGNDFSAEYLKDTSQGWKNIEGIMSTLGASLSSTMHDAYTGQLKKDLSEMERESIAEITKTMLEISAIMASSQAEIQMKNNFSKGLSAYSGQSIEDIINYYQAQKEASKESMSEAFSVYLDDLAAQKLANEKFLELAKSNGGEYAGKTLGYYQEEIDRIQGLYDKLAEMRDTSIRAALNFYTSGQGLDMVRSAILDAISVSDIDWKTKGAGNQNFLFTTIIEDIFNNSNINDPQNKKHLTTLLQNYLREVIANSIEDPESILDALDIGIIRLGDLFNLEDIMPEFEQNYGKDEFDQQRLAAINELLSELLYLPDGGVDGTELAELDITQPVAVDIKTEDVTSDLGDKIDEELQNASGSGGGGYGRSRDYYANMGASVMQGINATFANMKNILPWMNGSSDVTVKETRDSGEEIGNTAEGTRQGTLEIVNGQNTMNGYMQQVATYTSGMAESQGTANSYMAQMVSLLRTIASQGGGAAPAAQSVMGGMVAGALAAFEAVRG